MLNTIRVPRNTAALLISLTLATTALLGSAGGASAQEIPLGDYRLQIVASTAVPVLQEFTVRVEVIDDDRIVRGGCPSKVPVTLTITGERTWPQTVRTSGGVARFSVSLPKLGDWTLTAEVLGGACGDTFRPGTHQVTAVRIPASLPLPPCPPGMSCELTANGSHSAAQLIAEDGDFESEWQPSVKIPGCGARPLDRTNGVLEFKLISDEPVPQRLILALAPARVNTGIGHLQVCWLGEGKAEGRLLRPCQKDKPPCILFKKATKHNGALIGVSVPPGDPKAYIR